MISDDATCRNTSDNSDPDGKVDGGGTIGGGRRVGAESFLRHHPKV